VRRGSDSEKPRTTLQTVERALSVLEFVAASQRPPNVKDIAAGLQLNLTTVYHLFNTLEHRGYLHRDVSGAIRIGSRAGALHRAMVGEMVHSRELHPIIEEVSRATEETAYLTSWSHGAVVIQHVVEAPQALRVSGLYVGYRGREIERASGKAVLAHLDAPARTSVIDRCIVEIDESLRSAFVADLQSELEQVVRNGFALDNETYTPGVYCVAAPFFSESGEVAGSVSVSVPAVRFPNRQKTLIGAVLEAAHSCSRLMGNDPQLPAAR